MLSKGRGLIVAITVIVLCVAHTSYTAILVKIPEDCRIYSDPRPRANWNWDRWCDAFASGSLSKCDRVTILGILLQVSDGTNAASCKASFQKLKQRFMQNDTLALGMDSAPDFFTIGFISAFLLEPDNHIETLSLSKQILFHVVPTFRAICSPENVHCKVTRVLAHNLSYVAECPANVTNFRG